MIALEFTLGAPARPETVLASASPSPFGSGTMRFALDVLQGPGGVDLRVMLKFEGSGPRVVKVTNAKGEPIALPPNFPKPGLTGASVACDLGGTSRSVDVPGVSCGQQRHLDRERADAVGGARSLRRTRAA